MSVMQYDAVFKMPNGDIITTIVDDPSERFMGVIEITQDVPDWVCKRRFSYPCKTAKGAKLRANYRKSSGYMDTVTYKTVPITSQTVHILEAVEIKPTRLFCGLVEHNTWEGESWFWAFPSTDKIEAALKRLEDCYRSERKVVQSFEHSVGNIGKSSPFYTFRYGVSGRQWEVMPNLTKVEFMLDGRAKRTKKRLGGSYMGVGWLDCAATEDEALTVIAKAQAAFDENKKMVYKGYPLREG